MRRKPEQPRRSVDVAYMHANSTARDLMQRISEALDDMPAPGNDDCPIHWGHVGDVVEVNRRLSELLGFFTGTER